MLNRIRVVTMLMMVLVIFALLQLISGGLFFSSLKQNRDSFAASNDLRMQQSELTTTRSDVADAYQSEPLVCPHDDGSEQPAEQRKTELLKNARATLADAAKHYEAFKNRPSARNGAGEREHR